MREDEIMRQTDINYYTKAQNQPLEIIFFFSQVVGNRNIMEILYLEGRPSLNTISIPYS